MCQAEKAVATETEGWEDWAEGLGATAEASGLVEAEEAAADEATVAMVMVTEAG